MWKRKFKMIEIVKRLAKGVVHVHVVPCTTLYNLAIV